VSASLRKFRALVYEYDDVGSSGEIDSGYYLVPSTAADQAWWCARVTPTGEEVTVGMKPEHRIDAVLSFSTGVDIAPDIKDLPNYEYHTWDKLDEKNPEHRKLVEE
jgi:hypothetical protein